MRCNEGSFRVRSLRLRAGCSVVTVRPSNRNLPSSLPLANLRDVGWGTQQANDGSSTKEFFTLLESLFREGQVTAPGFQDALDDLMPSDAVGDDGVEMGVYDGEFM